MMFFLLFIFISPVFAFVNLFIGKAEMNRTLGLNAEMNYIEMGVVNGYSTKFPYRVDTHIDHIQFTWNAVQKVYYEMRAESEDMAVLPVLRIAEQGIVPNKIQDFSLEFRCAGHRSGQFAVSLLLNFTSFSSGESISVRLKQEKICVSRDGRRGMSGSFDHEFDASSKTSLADSERTFYIIISLASIFLLVIGGMLISYFRKSKKNGTQEGLRTPAEKTPRSFRDSIKTSRSALSSQPFLTSTPKQQAYASACDSMLGTSSLPSTSTSTEHRLLQDRPAKIDYRKTLATLHADRDSFQMLPFVDLEGTFGEIRFAIWRQLEEAPNGDVDDIEDAICNDEAVYCKTLKNGASAAQLEKFVQEALVFHKIPPHANLAQVACAASFDVPNSTSLNLEFPLICYRHRGFGSLKKFLLSCRDGEKRGSFIRTHDMTSLCLQASRALSHLHNHGLIHKDIAARNCLIMDCSGHLVLQLIDSSLSRDIFPSEYHCCADNDNRPIRWLPVETIRNNQYTSATDMWSFGVLCWEIFTLGVLPYPDIDGDDILSSLDRGIRLPQPNCPDFLYSVMLKCWNSNPLERPSADETTLSLQNFAVQLNHFI